MMCVRRRGGSGSRLAGADDAFFQGVEFVQICSVGCKPVLREKGSARSQVFRAVLREFC
jgi:hypothetical protein